MASVKNDTLQAAFPAKAKALFTPAPFKVFHGGRGGSKISDFCRALLILGSRRKLFILCTREITESARGRSGERGGRSLRQAGLP